MDDLVQKMSQAQGLLFKSVIAREKPEIIKPKM